MKPKLREIRTQPVVREGQQGILLSDPLSLSQKTLFIPGPLALLPALMDGTRDIGILRTGFELRSGMPLHTFVLQQLISELDEALFLENERFALAYKAALDDFHSAASRPPVLVGKCCPTNGGELSDFLEAYLDQVEDESPECPGEVKGLISPHIDFERGHPVYARTWSRVRTAVRQADLVVILGTDHNEGEGRITLTRQDYETPWGVIPTAQDVVDELVSEIGEEVFEYELNHRGEHSVEAAIIWLHYLAGNKPCPVLPVLCGSFQPFIESGESPLKASRIASTIEVLKRVAGSRRTVIVAAADLAHMGPVFGDPAPLDFAGRARMAEQDGRLVDIMCRGQADEFFAEILSERDRRHICGIPPIYIALSVLNGNTGMSAGYAQCPASGDGTSLVSICGILYHA